MPLTENIISIDFGSSKIVSAHLDKNNIASIITDVDTSRAMRTCLAFTEYQRLFGHAAEYQATVNARNTIRGSGNYYWVHKEMETEY